MILWSEISPSNAECNTFFVNSGQKIECKWYEQDAWAYEQPRIYRVLKSSCLSEFTLGIEFIFTGWLEIQTLM